MYPPLRIQRLAEKLAHLEQEVNVIRTELDELRQQAGTIVETASPRSIAVRWADKAAQRQQIDSVFAMLSIQGRPEGTESLQQRMAQTGLEQDELSRGIVEAREE